MTVLVREANFDDKPEWLKLRQSLWPACSKERHIEEIEAYLADPEKAVFLATLGDGKIVGFIEESLRRDYVEGCETSPVAYLEGIYVLEEYRGKGIAKVLIQNAERWAASHGCTEMGSDAELTNQGSINMHLRLGFEEANRVVHFVRQIG